MAVLLPPNADTAIPIKVKDLKVGHYVVLPGSWYTHPFFISRFKIKSPKQIEKIISMGYRVVTFLPGQSDPEVTREAVEQLVAGEPTQGTEVDAPDQPLKDGKDILEDAFKTYTGMAQSFGIILDHISCGREDGLLLANERVHHLAGLLLKEPPITALINETGLVNRSSVHALNVTTLSMIVGLELGLSQDELTLLGMGALMHDVGEQRIPFHTLDRKAAPLSPADAGILKQHPQYGVDIAGRLPFPPEALAIILQHHERLDGTGYPQGLKDDAISRLALIVSAVDTFEELRDPDSPDFTCPFEMLSFLYRKQGTWYPSNVVNALIRATSIYPPGTVIQLTDGAVALVLAVNGQHRSHPIVSVYDEKISSGKPTIIDLKKNTRLSIARALRLNQVPPDIQMYLNPRRMTGYFVGVSQSNESTQAL